MADSSARMHLPSAGQPWHELRGAMQTYAERDVAWREGRASVYIFHSGDDVMQVAHDAYGMFIAENGLGPAAFPSLKRMEREVIDMALSLQHAPAGAAGSMTSGGTESILLAVKACRDMAAEQGRGGARPEIVAPASVHPAFDKGAQLMGLTVKRIPCAADFRADVPAMADAITPHTIMLVGSAPCFPYGVVDPIASLSELALERGLWLHVDACVGGYINPFLQMLGDNPPPVYDLELGGVTSMSLDLHKYGYAAKGASTVLYRDRASYAQQIFDFDAWPCGRMFTPTFAGTRPGGAIAAAWAVLRYLGVDGYKTRAASILQARRMLLDALPGLGLKVFGNPQSAIVAFGWDHGDILAVGEGLYEAGWFSSRVQGPDGIQLMISPEHVKTMPNYLKVLEKCVEEVRSGERVRGAGKISYS